MTRSISLLTLISIFLVATILVLGYAVASFIALIVLLYTSIVVSKLYKGQLVSALTTSLNLLSVPTFVALLPSWEGAYPYFKPLSYSILLGVLAYSFFLIINSVSENYREIIYPVSRSMLLALVGLILWYLIESNHISQDWDTGGNRLRHSSQLLRYGFVLSVRSYQGAPRENHLFYSYIPEQKLVAEVYFPPVDLGLPVRRQRHSNK